MSDDFRNPFSAPTQSYTSAQPNQSQQQPGLGYVRQIPILGIITIVQGALIFLMSLLLIGYGIFFLFFFDFEGMIPEADRVKLAQSGPPFEIIGAVASGIGVVVFIIAAMHLIAGLRVLKYRGRGFIMTTWFLGLLVSLTFYCAPTSIGLAIWGLIVFFNPAVKTAFTMVEGGMDKREVERQFY